MADDVAEVTSTSLIHAVSKSDLVSALKCCDSDNHGYHAMNRPNVPNTARRLPLHDLNPSIPQSRTSHGLPRLLESLLFGVCLLTLLSNSALSFGIAAGSCRANSRIVRSATTVRSCRAVDIP